MYNQYFLKALIFPLLCTTLIGNLESHYWERQQQDRKDIYWKSLVGKVFQ